MPSMIPVGDSLSATVDDADLHAVVHHRWHPLRNGSRVYARSSIKIDGRFRTVLMHRLLLAPPARALVDHRDGDGLNNTRANLRVCTSQQNSANCRARGASGLIGVRRGSGGWIASIAPAGVEIHLGTYPTPILAAQAHDAAAVCVYRDFARLNGTADASILERIVAGKRDAIARLLQEISILKGVA